MGMKEPRKGLGRGLSALMGEETPKATQQVDIRLIDNNVNQPRKEFNSEKLVELSESIKRHGVVQPIIVTRNGERYTIVAGERRFRAARLANLSTIPVLVREMSEQEIYEVALIENIQREDLNPIEEAVAIRYLMEQNDLTQEEVARRLGKSRSSIANSVRLLNLSDSICEMIRTEKLQPGHAKVLLGIADEHEREEFAARVVENNWTVRELEERLSDARTEKKQKKTVKKQNIETDDGKNPFIADAEKRLRQSLGTKVTILGNNDNGKLVIEYYDAETLTALFDMLCRD